MNDHLVVIFCIFNLLFYINDLFTELKMVLKHKFSEIFDRISSNSKLNLPIFKENGLRIQYFKEDTIECVYSSVKPPLPFANSEVYNAEISSWRKLTEDEACKPVYEITLDVQGSNLEFKAGDTIGIIPHNLSSEVETVLSHIDLKSQADIPYHLTVDSSVKGSKIPPHVPVKSTLRHVLTYCVDLRGILKKLFLLALSRYTKDEDERKILEFLCSKEGATSYETHILDKNVNIIDIFNIFQTCKPPIHVLLANLPRLLPRPYSVVNSGLSDANLIKICFSVMSIGNNRKGLTTGWLEQLINKGSDIEKQFQNLSLNEKNIPMYIRKNISNFALPDSLERPMIFIGPGTGVAPYLSFLEQLKMCKENSEVKLGETWLYFGCRDPKLDFIYEEELNQYLKNGVLTRLRTAFSRMDDSEFKYIQDALVNDGEDIVRFIKDGCYIYVCGDLKTMAAEVKDIIVECLMKYDGKSKEDAEKCICDMQKDQRYVVDVWS